MKQLLRWRHPFSLLWVFDVSIFDVAPIYITHCLIFHLDAIVVFQQLLIVLCLIESSFFPVCFILIVDKKFIGVEWIPWIALVQFTNWFRARCLVVFCKYAWYQEDTGYKYDYLDHDITQDVPLHYLAHDQLWFILWRSLKDWVIWWLTGQSDGTKSVHNEVNPNQLHGT